ncbi:O-succinylbenzoic acid--CoA ligase [Micromonospora nigra]|uniref:O-succinylbenzoic acid--CoA ligase n=1 Tax=Micromonospora nigra TaxID=145857 RepID=A0A1C6RD58_9ACTN|nr:AMP-binding protein [Micromonospora nigra]SCL15041.1 O-succinylbenzoic acid--CoA ligase [Micromonospora nigra]
MAGGPTTLPATEAADGELTEADLSLDGPVTTETWLGAPARSYPRRPRSIVAVLEQAARRWPDALAMVDETGARATFAELADLVRGGAAEQRRRGLVTGDRVVVAARNRLDMAVAIFSCAAAGTVLVGLNLRLARDEWAWMIRRSTPRLVLGQPELLPALTEAAEIAGLPADRVERLRLPDPVADAGRSAFEPDEADAYQVVWTSGTTGRPKASKVVHRCSVHSAMSYQKVLGLRPGDRTAVLFPLYYISAMHAHVLPAMLAGATSVLVETNEPGRWLDLLARHQVTWAYAVPSWWSLVAREPRFTAAGLPALRVAAAGGAPFPAELVALFRQRLPDTRLIDVYGLTETHSPATMLLDEEFATRPGSVGRALPCMAVEIRDDEGRPLPTGQVGEVFLRGSLVTTGYWGDAEATAAGIVDGWFRSGDVGRVDADGYLYVLDRKKDMINRGGHKVFSAEVERVIRQCPGVADVAVVAVPDRVAGEAVAAVVVTDEGTRLAPLAVRRWVRDRLADYAAPTVVRFTEELPRNSTGKTDKLALRRMLAPAKEQR